MIVNENVADYIDSLYKDGSEFMEDLRSEAEEDLVPIIRRQTEGFIKSLLLLRRPERILEIGTGVAYSAIFMCETLPECRITTIENYAPRIEAAKRNIKRAGLEERIELIEKDVACALLELKGPYDFIFLDGPKAQYELFLPELLRMTEAGGVILADNVLQDGDISLSRFAVARRQRTIHERLRKFLYDVTHSPHLDTSILTIGDGLSLSIKK